MFHLWRRSLPYAAMHHSHSGSVDGNKDGLERHSFDNIHIGDFSRSNKDASPSRQQVFLKLGVIASAMTVIFTLVAISVLTSRHHTSSTPSDGANVQVHVSSSSKSNSKPHPCGNSSAQARFLGCTFNQLMWTWLPPDCPSYANDLFMQAEDRPWVYYEDLGQTKIAEGDVWEEVLDGERRVFGERREHTTHCVYLLLSLAQIIRDRTPYFESLVQYDHAEHCADMLLDLVRKEPGRDKVQTFGGTVSFDQSCG